MPLKNNIENVRQKIATAAQKSGRNPQDIKLIAVTKTVPAEIVEQAIVAGVADIGENRVQEAMPKIELLKQKYPQITWHMIGHLQRNKVRQSLELFDIIQSVDSQRLAQELDKKAQELNKVIPVLIEVNISGEASKNGVPADRTIDLIESFAGLKHIRVEGLMTIPPWSEDPEQARPYFKHLKNLFEQIKILKIPQVELKYLSMGMSDDFVVAIEEGANLVRVGRAIFGKRGKK
jgi:PLP dependent protein